MKPTVSPQTAAARFATRRSRRAAALALLLVPALAVPAAAQQRDRASVVSFRTEVPQTDARIAAPPAAVWKALTEVYAEMGFPLAEMANPRAHEYLTPFMDLRGRLFNKPNGEYFSCSHFDTLNDLTNTGQITFAIRTRLQPADGGTAVHTQVDARARRRGGSGSAVECSTTGNFEEALMRLVDERVQQAAAPAAPAASAAPTQPE